MPAFSFRTKFLQKTFYFVRLNRAKIAIIMDMVSATAFPFGVMEKPLTKWQVILFPFSMGRPISPIVFYKN